MNTAKIREAIGMITEALHEEGAPTDAQWAEFGRACAEAVRHCYDVSGVSRAAEHNRNWRPCATRLWHAAKPLGLHGYNINYSAAGCHHD